MRLSVTTLVLAAFLAVAVGIGVVGALLARRETTVRLERDRGEHEQVAIALREELHRLDGRYEAHLQGLFRLAETDTGPAFVAACRNIKGVRHFSRLDPQRKGDLQIEIRTPNSPPVPVPIIKGTGGPAAGSRRELLAEQVFGAERTPGRWLHEPNQPMIYLRNTNGSAFLLTIDRAEVEAAMEGWMAPRFLEPMTLLSRNAALDRLVSPARRVVAGSFQGDQASDWVLPVASLFGTWRIESVDVRESRRTWNLPVLAGTVAGALFVAVIGTWLAFRIRSESRRAEQRVSFVNRVSHELRTPLTNILLNLEIAGDEIDHPTTTRRLGLVREEAQRLGRLIENVLTFSRRGREEKTVAIKACSPAAILHTLLDQFGAAFARRGITVRAEVADLGAWVLHADAFTQIAANLFSNVEKYAPGSEMFVRLKTQTGALVLQVEDTGPGIPADAGERIFQPFERLDDRTIAGISGTGLGLAICRDLARQMRGELKLLPSSRGAAFELRVPVSAVPNLQDTSAA